MDMPALRVLLVCVVLIGAAYGAAPTDHALATGDSVESSAGSITVEGDPGGVDAQRAYERLQGLYGRDLPEVTANFHRAGGVDFRETYPDPFFALLADPTVRIKRPVRGAASGKRASVSYRNGTSPAVVERVLVHELAHALQPPSLRESMESAAGDYGETTDAAFAREAVAEGAAVYVADAYTLRHLGILTESARLALEWPGMTDATRLLWAPYRYGAEHVRERVASPAHLAIVYENPPMTTEQVLHPFRAATGPRPLAVESNEIGKWDPTATDTKGELYLRVLLESDLPPDRAVDAATGWGNDRLVAYEDRDEVSFAWVLRWDSPQDAAEFERALSASLNATAERRGETWTDGDVAFRAGRVAGETRYLLAGDPGFVESARVTGNESNVTVVG